MLPSGVIYPCAMHVTSVAHLHSKWVLMCSACPRDRAQFFNSPIQLIVNIYSWSLISRQPCCILL